MGAQGFAGTARNTAARVTAADAGDGASVTRGTASPTSTPVISPPGAPKPAGRASRLWTEAEKRRLIELANAGLSVSMIAKELGRPANSVKSMRGDLRAHITCTLTHGERVKAGKRPVVKWTAEETADLLRMYQVEGMQAPEIGERLGRSAFSVEAKLGLLGARKISADYTQAPFMAKHPQAAKRRCLSCRKDFDSEHRGNRICSACKDGHASIVDGIGHRVWL